MSIKHLYPTSTPALNLNPKSSRVADPRLSCVRNSIGTYVDPVSGLVKTASANVARVEKGGLLVEESRTNEVQFSEDYNATGWTRTGITSTINSGTAPDGTNTASLVQSTVNGPASLKYFVATTGATTLSAFVKAGTSHTIHLYLHDDQVKFDLLTETITAASSATIFATSIRDVGNGWYRCSMTSTRTGQTEKRVIVNNSDGSYQASIGDNVYVWGVQIEEGDSSTSYIPTSGSTVQRLADQISFLNGGTFNELEHTIVNRPFGVAQAVITSGNETRVDLLPGRPIERLAIHSDRLTGNEVTAISCDDEFWKVRVLGSSFAFDQMTTDGVVKVDWGDGTAIETLTTASHTFANGGGYHDIGLKLESGTYFKPQLRSDPEVIAVGPTPLSMKLDGENIFRNTDVLTFDAGIKFHSITRAFNDSSSLRVLPFIDTSEAIFVGMSAFFYQNTDLQRVPLFDTSSASNWTNAFRRCNDLKELPHFDTSSATTFLFAFQDCSTLQSIPAFNTSNVTEFTSAFDGCSNITSFPAIDLSAGIKFQGAWKSCGNLLTFPANMFDNLSTPARKCFSNTWQNCSSLNAAGVENILVSIAASGAAAHSGTGSTDRNITIDYNSATGGLTTNTTNAIATLKSRTPAWEIYINNVLQ